MPQSLANVLIHVIFSTKDRRPVLTDEIRKELYPYIGGVLRNLNCPVLQIGGVDDHVHVLFRMSRTMTLAQIVEKIKTSTSRWIKTKGSSFQEFSWQAGYGAFSINATDVDKIRNYIENQQEHHRKISFQDELRALLKESGVEFDERHLWD